MKGNKIAIDRYLETGEVVDSLDLSVNYLVKYVREGGTVPAKNTLVYCTGFNTSTKTPTGVWTVENTDTTIDGSTIGTAVNSQGQTGYLNEISGNSYTSINGNVVLSKNWLQKINLPRVTSITNISASGNGFFTNCYRVTECNLDGLTSWGGGLPLFNYLGHGTTSGCDLSLMGLNSISNRLFYNNQTTLKSFRAESLTTVPNRLDSGSYPLVESTTPIDELYLPLLENGGESLMRSKAKKFTLPSLIHLEDSGTNAVVEEFEAPNLETTDSHLFYNFTSLTYAYIPKLRVVGEQLANYCTSLTSLSIPSLESCWDLAITCDNLTSLYAPSLKTCSYLASSCNSLVTVSAPSLEECGGTLLQNCKELINVNLPSFSNFKSGNTGNLIANCPKVEEINLPSITSLNYTAQMFSNCYGLKKVVFGENLRSTYSSISSSSIFANCYSLSSVEFQNPNQVVTLSTGRFKTSENVTAILVPSNLVDSYKSATNWSAFAERIYSSEHEASTVVQTNNITRVEWYEQYVPFMVTYSLHNTISLDGTYVDQIDFYETTNTSLTAPNLSDEVVNTTKSYSFMGQNYNATISQQPHNNLKAYVYLSDEWSGYTFNEESSSYKGTVRFRPSGTGRICVSKIYFSGSGKYTFLTRGDTSNNYLMISKVNSSSYPLSKDDPNLLYLNNSGEEEQYSIDVSNGDYIWVCSNSDTNTSQLFYGWSTLEMQPSYYTDLTIDASDVNGRATTAPLTYECVGHITPTESLDIEVSETGTGTSSSFPQNTSYTDTVQRTVTFSIHDLTASDTITQGVWIDSYIATDLTPTEARYGWTNTSVVAPEGYDIYMSDNYHVSSSQAVCKLTFYGYLDCDIYIRSYGESNYDYTIASTVNANTFPTYYSGSTVASHTRGNQHSGTTLADYTKVSYTGLNDGDYVWIVYVKDGSGDTGDDRGYVLIPQ